MIATYTAQDAYQDARADYALRVIEYNRQRRVLRTALKAQGISFARFARECGCSASNISAYVSDVGAGERNGWPIPAYIWRRAEAMGLLKDFDAA